MKKNIILAGVVAIAHVTVLADGWAVLDGGWRISAGAVYDPGVKTELNFTPPAAPTSPFVQGMSRAAAEQTAQGTKTSDTRTDFANGGWIDTADPVYSTGDDVGKTRYYKFPVSGWNGDRSFTLGSATYSEVETRTVDDRPSNVHASDDAGILGANIELSRNLFHDAEYGFGLDLAFGVTYFKHNGVFSTAAKWSEGSAVRRSGMYESTIDLPEGEYDDWNWHGVGESAFYGSGSYAGNAGPIDGTSIHMNHTESVSTRTTSGSLYANGDYDNLEMMLMLRPYYDVFDWLRINAMLGAVVSRQDLDFTLMIRHDGVLDYRSNRDFSQWDVYGIGGGGLMICYKDFTLSADILARFLDRDLDVDGKYVHGSVERGRWMLRLSLGYEF